MDDTPKTPRSDLKPIQISERTRPGSSTRDIVFDVQKLSLHYGSTLAISEITVPIYKNHVTAFIGPSGCGKSTFIRCLNRMNDLVPIARVTGQVLYHGQDIYGPTVDPVQVRRHIGMVFQKPNPFPKSIYDNIAWGLKILGKKDNLDDRVEQALPIERETLGAHAVQRQHP